MKKHTGAAIKALLQRNDRAVYRALIALEDARLLPAAGKTFAGWVREWMRHDDGVREYSHPLSRKNADAARQIVLPFADKLAIIANAREAEAYRREERERELIAIEALEAEREAEGRYAAWDRHERAGAY
jgi:hypothetical protein